MSIGEFICAVMLNASMCECAVHALSTYYIVFYTSPISVFSIMYTLKELNSSMFIVRYLLMFEKYILPFGKGNQIAFSTFYAAYMEMFRYVSISVYITHTYMYIDRIVHEEPFD